MLTGPSILPEVVTSAVIFMHGFGSDGQDLISLAPYMQADLTETAFFAPNGVAPTPFGQGYQWFSDNDWTFKDREGMDIAQTALEGYIDHVMQQTKLQPENIVIVSFSQGTMTALFAAPRMKHKIAGLVGLSGRMFWDEELSGTAYHKLPVTLIHGRDDDVVDPNSSPESAARLRALGFDVDLTMLDGLGHGIDERALETTIAAVKRYIKDK